MKGKLLIPSSEFCVLMIPLHVALIPSIITSISSPPSLYTHPSLQFPFYPSPSFPPSHPYYFPSIPHSPMPTIFLLSLTLPSLLFPFFKKRYFPPSHPYYFPSIPNSPIPAISLLFLALPSLLFPLLSQPPIHNIFSFYNTCPSLLSLTHP